MKKVYGLIRRLGANSKYKGYFFVAEAVKISMGDQCKPLRISVNHCGSQRTFIHAWHGSTDQHLPILSMISEQW